MNLFILAIQATFFGTSAYFIQEDVLVIASCVIGATSCSYVLIRNISGPIAFLSLSLFNYLYFAHASLREREFSDLTVDAQVIVRTLCAAILLGLLVITFLRSRRSIPLSLAEFALPGLGCYILLTSLLSPTSLYSAVCGGLWVILALSGIYLTREVGIAAAFRVIALAMLALVITSLLMLVLQVETVWTYDWISGRQIPRFKGAFLHPVQLGNGASLLFVYISYRLIFISRLPKLERIALILSLAATMALMFYAQSRLGAVVSLMCLFYMLHYRFPAGGYALGALGASFGLVLLAALGVEDLAAVLTRSGEIEEIVTLTGRTVVWDYSWHFIEQSWALGHGYGATRALFATAPGIFGWTVSHSHNLVLQSLLELGVIGSFPLMFLLVWLAYGTLTFRNVLVGAITIQLIVRGLTEVVVLFLVPGMMLICLAIAVTELASIRRSEKAAKTQSAARRPANQRSCKAPQRSGN